MVFMAWRQGTLADARCVLWDVMRHAKERFNVCFVDSFAALYVHTIELILLYYIYSHGTK